MARHSIGCVLLGRLFLTFTSLLPDDAGLLHRAAPHLGGVSPVDPVLEISR